MQLLMSMRYVAQQHDAVIPNLLGPHALSGCDTIFSYIGIGKATVLKRLMTFTDNLCLGDLSASTHVSDLYKLARNKGHYYTAYLQKENC